uniref:Subtilisin n=1 Tax=Alexandrium andersonii TaxID=327968 RepID=A0A7S2IHJ8_9DINO|mmetsp:Transcript_83021/g.185338  ORF Transcript_83021/g.185338 Transcript_83021/m.185338 type:complete len:149 (+) Transcript_83021:80-526(+)
MACAKLLCLLAAFAVLPATLAREGGLAAPSAKPTARGRQAAATAPGAQKANSRPLRAPVGLADLEMEMGPRVQTAVLVCVGEGQCEKRLAGRGLDAEGMAARQREARELAEKQGFACGGGREPCYALPTAGLGAALAAGSQGEATVTV